VCNSSSLRFSFYLSLQDLEDELQDVTKQREERQASLSSLLEKTRAAVARLNKLSKYASFHTILCGHPSQFLMRRGLVFWYRTLEEYQSSAEQRKQAVVERMSEVRYLQGKTAEAQATMQKLKVYLLVLLPCPPHPNVICSNLVQEEISSSGVSTEITHSALIKVEAGLAIFFLHLCCIDILFSCSLVQLNAEWKAWHEKTGPLLESLKKYHQLPPVAFT